jgi:hypothetical protein
MVALTHTYHQASLIHFVESDDLFLHDQVDVVWFDVLNTLDYRAFQATAAHYYEQLFTFNQQQKQRRIERREYPPSPNAGPVIRSSCWASAKPRSIFCSAHHWTPRGNRCARVARSERVVIGASLAAE